MTKETRYFTDEEKKEISDIVTVLVWVHKTSQDQPDYQYSDEEKTQVGLAMLKSLRYPPMYIAELVAKVVN